MCQVDSFSEHEKCIRKYLRYSFVGDFKTKAFLC